MMEAHADYRRGRYDEALRSTSCWLSLAMKLPRAMLPTFLTGKKQTCTMQKRCGSERLSTGPGLLLRVTLQLGSDWEITFTMVGALGLTTSRPPATTGLQVSSRTTLRPCSTLATCTSWVWV